MVDDGKRLYYYFRGKHVNVSDTVNNTSFCSENGCVAVATLDVASIFDHVKTIEELLLGKTMSWIGLRVPSHDYRMRGVQIIEDVHFKYVFNVDGRYAELTDQYFRGQKQFNVSKLLNALHGIYAAAYNAKAPLNPATNVVRKFPDIGVCAWSYNGHTVMLLEKNISVCNLHNCLADDKFYEMLIVTLIRRNQQDIVELISVEGDVVFTCPRDAAFNRYFGSIESTDVDAVREEVGYGGI